MWNFNTSKDLECLTKNISKVDDDDEEERYTVVNDHGCGDERNEMIYEGSLHFPASIFFIYGFIYFHHDEIFSRLRYTHAGHEIFLECGYVLLAAALALAYPMKCDKGNWTSIVSMISIVLYFAGNSFILDTLVLQDTNDFDPFLRPFTIGSWMFCVFQSIDLFFYVSENEYRKNTVASMIFAVLGSLSFYLGGLLHLMESLNNCTALYILGSVFYLLHSVCYFMDDSKKECAERRGKQYQ